MKITFDAKSILLGVVLGTMLTVYRASIAVAKDHIEKQEKAQAFFFVSSNKILWYNERILSIIGGYVMTIIMVGLAFAASFAIGYTIAFVYTRYLKQRKLRLSSFI